MLGFSPHCPLAGQCAAQGRAGLGPPVGRGMNLAHLSDLEPHRLTKPLKIKGNYVVIANNLQDVGDIPGHAMGLSHQVGRNTCRQ
jgi:hypothetical protein